MVRTGFKVEDRVKYTGDFTGDLRGLTGTVIRESGPTSSSVRVRWDIDPEYTPRESGVMAENITHIEKENNVPLTLSDFNPGDRVAYTGGVTLKEGTVTRVDSMYVRVKWDSQDYNGFSPDSGVYPCNLRTLVPATAEQSFATNLRKLAADARDKARAQNRIAEKAEALASEMERVPVAS